MMRFLCWNMKGMPVRHPLFVIALLFICGTVFAKAPNPFDGTIHPEKIAARAGTVVSLSVKFETHQAFEKVGVSINVPDGLSLIAGKKNFEIDNFKPGERKDAVYKLRVLDEGEKNVTVTVKALGLGKNAAYSRDFIAIINPSPKLENSTVKKDGEGAKIRVTTVPQDK